MERPTVHLKLRLPRARWVALALVIGLVTVAYAAVPHGFNAGDPLSASKLNENFTALDRRGTYCGATPPVQPRLDPANGYRGGAMMCATVEGCGPAARICTPTEIVRATSENMNLPSGWIATGLVGVNSSFLVDDCTGFTSNTGQGIQWTGQRPRLYNCNDAVTLPLLCCR